MSGDNKSYSKKKKKGKEDRDCWRVGVAIFKKLIRESPTEKVMGQNPIGAGQGW